MDKNALQDAIQFLKEGQELEAARLLEACVLENFEMIDNWWDGSRQLDGMLLELACPRAIYEILVNERDPLTKSITNAFVATFPSDWYLKRFAVRAVPALRQKKEKKCTILTEAETKGLISASEAQKACIIAVATGGPRIEKVNREYGERRQEIKRALDRLSVPDPNPYADLWAWYGKWSDGSLPTYQSRRRYIAEMYQPLLDALSLGSTADKIQPQEPTGWARVDRIQDKIVKALETARNEEDFQAVALLCREGIISLAQAVYDPEQHESLDGVKPSPTDAKRMLESYISDVLKGGSHDYQRKYAKSTFDLAVNRQHRRTATFRDAALCAEATRSLINVISILSGRRDPEKI
jgi:hypothetical protein